MADLYVKNRSIFIKRYERDRAVAQSQILAKEVRIMELYDEIERCNSDIEAQKKVIADMDFNIEQQKKEIEKEEEKLKETNVVQ